MIGLSPPAEKGISPSLQDAIYTFIHPTISVTCSLAPVGLKGVLPCEWTYRV